MKGPAPARDFGPAIGLGICLLSGWFTIWRVAEFVVWVKS